MGEGPPQRLRRILTLRLVVVNALDKPGEIVTNKKMPRKGFFITVG